jgi:hypothetical protein
MTRKRRYTETVASIETALTYINNHLKNIDSHLNRQNEALTEHSKAIARHGAWITAFKWLIIVATSGGVGTGIWSLITG